MENQRQSKHQIIFDTCIIQYATDSKYSEEVSSLITRLSQKFEFAMSAISIYEVFGGLGSSKADRQKIHDRKAFCDSLVKIPIEIDHVRFASALCTFYRNHPHTKYHSDKYKLADTLIGSQALMITGFVLTANRVDFPFPFFTEVPEETYILKPERERAIDIALLKPSVTAFNEQHGVTFS